MRAPRIRYQLNLRAILILTVLGLATAPALFFLWGYQEKRVLRVALEQVKVFQEASLQAKDRAAQGRANDLALRHLNPYLDYRPDDPEALEIEAALLTARKDDGGAAKVYERLLRIDKAGWKAHQNARRRLAAYYIHFSDDYRSSRFAKVMSELTSQNLKYNIAEIFANQLLAENAKANPPVDDPETHRLRAMALEGQIIPNNKKSRAGGVEVVVVGRKEPEKGEKTLEEAAILEYQNALALDPGDVVAADRLAKLFQKAKKPDDARKVLDDLLKARPDEVDVRTVRYYYFREIDDTRAAADELAAANELDPENLGIILIGAENALQSDSKDTAEARRWLDKVPTGYDLRLMSWGDGSGVPTSGNNLVIVGADNHGLLHIRFFDAGGNRVTDTDETKLPPAQVGAITTFKQQLQGLLPPHVLTSPEKTQAIIVVTSILGQTLPTESHKEPPVFLVRGMIEYSEKHYDTAISIWKAGLDNDNPSDLGLTQRLALVLLELGRDKEAEKYVDQYRRLVEDQDPVLRFLEAIQDEHASRFSPAIEGLRWALDRLPEGYQETLHLALGRCYEKQGEWDEAEKSYRTALQLRPKSVALRLSLARLLLEKRPEEAARELAQGLISNPNQPELLITLTHAKLQEQKSRQPARRNWTAEFDPVYKQALAAAPQSSELALLYAERLVAEDANVKRAKEFLKVEFEKAPESAALAIRLAEYLQSQGLPEQALQVLAKASDPKAAGDRGWLRIQRALVMAALGQGREARALLVRNVDKLPPADQNEIWRFLVLLCKNQGDQETTQAAYNEWLRLLPNDPRPKLALLEMEIVAGDPKVIHGRLESLRPGYDLRLMSWGDGSGVPTSGNNLVIVGADNHGLLHIRFFDAGGNRVTDTDETKLPPAQVGAITTFKQQLQGLLPPHVLTSAEKTQAIIDVTSILGQTLRPRHDQGKRDFTWSLAQARALLWRITLIDTRAGTSGAKSKETKSDREALLKEADKLVEDVLHDIKIDPAALLLKGQILEKENAREKALDAYTQAWNRGSAEALFSLVDLLVDLKRTEDLDRLRQSDTTKQLDQIVAATHLKKGQKEEALRIVQQSLTEMPVRQAWQVGILDSLGENEKSESTLRALAEQSDRLETWLKLVRFLADHGRNQAVTDTIAEIKRRLKVEWPELLEAECRWAASDFSKADTAFEVARKLYPEVYDVQLVASRYFEDRGRHEAAEACLRGILDRNPNDRSVIRQLAVVITDQAGRPDAWKEALELLGPEGPTTNTPEEYDLRLMSWGDGSGVPTSGNNLVIVGADNHGLLHIRFFDAGGNRVADTDETKLPAVQVGAITTFKQQLQGLLPPRVLTRAEKTQAIIDVTSILGQTPPEERLARAIVLARSRDEARSEHAIALLQALVADMPAGNTLTASARDILTRLLLDKGHAEQASKVAAIAAAKGANPGAIILYAEALLQSKQFDAAEEQRKRLAKLEPGNVYLAPLRARVIQGLSKPGEAADALEDEYLAMENSAGAEAFGREAFALIFAMGSNARAVAERLGTHLAERNPALSWMPALFLASRGKRKDALTRCRKAVESGKNPIDLRSACRIAVETVATHSETTALTEADKIVDEAMRQNATEDDELHVFKALLSHLKGPDHYPEEVEHYRKVLEHQPRNSVALNNIAWSLAVGLNQPKEAMEKIDELIKVAGRNAEYLDTRGVILMRLGRLKDSVQDFEEAVKIEPNGTRLYHLALAYKKMGRDAEFRQALDEARRAGLTAGTLDPNERDEFEALTNLLSAGDPR